MAKTYEEFFIECQENAVRAALEFAEFRKEVEKVFVYAGYLDKPDVYASNYFFQVNGKIIYPGEINDELPPGSQIADTSGKREVDLLGPINNSFKRFLTVCKEKGWKFPAEIRVTKDMRTHALRADCLEKPRP